MNTQTKTSEDRIAEAKDRIETARREWLDSPNTSFEDYTRRLDAYEAEEVELYAILAETSNLIRVRERRAGVWKIEFAIDAIGISVYAETPKEIRNRMSYGRFSTLDAALAAKWEIESAEENRLRGYDRD